MGYSREVVRRERAESQVHATPGIIQDIDGRGKYGFIFASCEGENVGVVNYRSEVGGRYQIGYHSQWFARTVPVSGCELGEAGEDRF